MRRVALIYNPASGQHFYRRSTAIDKALAILREAGVEAEALQTFAPNSAGALAEQAVSRGCDTVIACGGDGTVHEVLQSLVGTTVALGVVPLGTAGKGSAKAVDRGPGACLRGPNLLSGCNWRHALPLLYRDCRRGLRRSVSFPA